MQTYNKDHAKELAEKIVEAEAALSRYLGECFPIGERAHAKLNIRQVNPTFCKIVGIEPTIYGGEVRVHILSSKARSSRRFRSLPAADVTTINSDSSEDCDGGSRAGHCDY